jgi:hypothetical protein
LSVAPLRAGYRSLPYGIHAFLCNQIPAWPLLTNISSLSRIPNESEPLPDELKIPIGIAENLRFPVLPTTSGPNIQGPMRSAEDNGIEDESVDGKRHGTDTPVTVRFRHYM